MNEQTPKRGKSGSGTGRSVSATSGNTPSANAPSRDTTPSGDAAPSSAPSESVTPDETAHDETAPTEEIFASTREYPVDGSFPAGAGTAETVPQPTVSQPPAPQASVPQPPAPPSTVGQPTSEHPAEQFPTAQFPTSQYQTAQYQTAQDRAAQDSAAQYGEAHGAAPTRQAPIAPRRTVRYAGLAWGLILCAVSALTFYVVLSPERRNGLGEWLTALNGASLTAVTALGIGVIVLVIVLLSALRSSQHRR